VPGRGRARVRDDRSRRHARERAPASCSHPSDDRRGRPPRVAAWGGGKRRARADANHCWSEFYGFEGSSGVSWSAATTRPRRADPALLRSGPLRRLGSWCRFPHPRCASHPASLTCARSRSAARTWTRRSSRRGHARLFRRGPGETWLGWGWGGNESALFSPARVPSAWSNGRLSTRDKDKVIMDRASSGRVNRPRGCARTPRTHEAGPRRASRALLPKTDRCKRSRIPPARALGLTMHAPVEDPLQLQPRLPAHNMPCSSRRHREELFMNQMTTGASTTSSAPPRMRRRMVTEWACRTRSARWSTARTGEVFPRRSVTTHQNWSEDTMRSVDKKWRPHHRRQYTLALAPARGEIAPRVEVIAKALLEWETPRRGSRNRDHH